MALEQSNASDDQVDAMVNGAGLAVAEALSLYRDMLRIRLVEEEIAARYSDQEMRCPVHLSVGQEAAAVGVCAALGPDDQIVSTHRCHSHYLAKGGDLNAMMAEIYGKATGCCGGRGGSMHLFDNAAGVLASVPIVASSIPLGVGAALAFQQQGKKHVAVVFMGDGSVEEGVWHESANFAAVRKLPVVFVLENNYFAVYTDLADRQPKRPLTDLAVPFAMPAMEVDGNDIRAVHSATLGAVASARAGLGPSLLVLETYRWREHCGPNYDNDLGYRSVADFEAWKARDPVEAWARTLRAQGLLDRDAEDRMLRDLAAETAAAFDFAKLSPMPDPRPMESTVYA